MSKDATLKEHAAAQKDIPIQVTMQGGQLVPNPLAPTATANDWLIWTGSQEFQIDFTAEPPGQEKKLCAQPQPDGTYQARSKVTRDKPPKYYDCHYTISATCTPTANAGQHAQGSMAVDPIIIVDCASCGGGGDNDDKHRHGYEK